MMFEKPYTIVLIDDDEDVAEILGEYINLTMPGIFQVKSFNFPEPALKYILESPVHLVLTDLHMPQITGEQLLQKIRDLKRGIKTVITTGLLTQKDAALCYNLGVDGFLQKPFSQKSVETVLKLALDNLAMWEEIHSHCPK